MITNPSSAHAGAEPDVISGRPRPRLRRWEASAYLKDEFGIVVAPATLAKLASVGGGPKFQKQNTTVLYPLDELDAWAAKRLGPVVSSTSETYGTEHTEPA